LVPGVKEEMYLRTCVFILLGIYIKRRKVSFPCLFIPSSYTDQSNWFIRVPRVLTKKKERKRRGLKKWNTRISATEIIIYTKKVRKNRAESRHALQTGNCLQAVVAPNTSPTSKMMLLGKRPNIRTELKVASCFQIFFQASLYSF
jgi:hypothetical protein